LKGFYKIAGESIYKRGKNANLFLRKSSSHLESVYICEKQRAQNVNYCIQWNKKTQLMVLSEPDLYGQINMTSFLRNFGGYSQNQKPIPRNNTATMVSHVFGINIPDMSIPIAIPINNIPHFSI
jgi:hypothetical protein